VQWEAGALRGDVPDAAEQVCRSAERQVLGDSLLQQRHCSTQATGSLPTLP